MSVSIEDFAREIESGALDTLESWIADGSIDVNARSPRANEPPSSATTASTRLRAARISG